MNDHIIRLIKIQTCASVFCVDEQGSPYCFSCFYVFNSEESLLYFKSSASAHYSTIVSNNFSIADTILPEKLRVLMVKGIQFTGSYYRISILSLRQHCSIIKNPCGTGHAR